MRVCSQPTSPALPLHEVWAPPRRRLSVPTSYSVSRLELVSVTHGVFDCSSSAIHIRSARSTHTSEMATLRSGRTPQQPRTTCTRWNSAVAASRTRPEGRCRWRGTDKQTPEHRSTRISAVDNCNRFPAPGSRCRCKTNRGLALRFSRFPPLSWEQYELAGGVGNRCTKEAGDSKYLRWQTPHASPIYLSEMPEFTQCNVQHLALHLHQIVKRQARA